MPVASMKGRALLAYLALRETPAPRMVLAELLWGPSGGRNLRQLLYTLRKLPGAEEWLHDGELVSVDAEWSCDGDGEVLEDLDGSRLGRVCAEWLEDARVRLAVERDALSPGLEEEIASLVSACREPRVSVIAAAVGLPERKVAGLVARLPPGGEASAAVHHRLALVHDDPVERAWHWGRAGEPDREAEAHGDSGDWLRAAKSARELDTKLEYSERAVAEAERTDGTADVAEWLRTWAATEPDPRVGHLDLLVRARSAWRSGQGPLAADLADDAYRMAKRHGLDVSPSSLVLGQSLLSRGQIEDALVAFDRATQGKDARTVRLGFAGRGAARAMLGDLDDALEDHEEALALAREASDAVAVARSLCNVASDLNRLGRFASATRRYEEAVEAARRLGDGAMTALALSNGALNALWAGELGTCRRWVREATDAAGEAPRARALALDCRAELESWCGRKEEAVGWSKRAVALHIAVQDEPRAAMSRANCAVYEASMDSGLVGAAMQAIDGVLERGRPHVAWQLTLDLGMFAKVPLAWVRERRPEQPHALAESQWALVRARHGEPALAELERVASQASHLQVFAVAALGGDPLVLRERSKGLLTDQAESLAELVHRWAAKSGEVAGH